MTNQKLSNKESNKECRLYTYRTISSLFYKKHGKKINFSLKIGNRVNFCSRNDYDYEYTPVFHSGYKIYIDGELYYFFIKGNLIFSPKLNEFCKLIHFI